MTDFVQKYFNQALDSFLDSQRNMEQVMRSAMGLPAGTPTLADWTKLMWNPLQNNPWASGAAPNVTASANGAATEPATAPPPPAEDANLCAAVQQLQEEVARPRRAAKPPRPGRRAKS